MTEQSRQASRVSARIGAAILAFRAATAGQRWHADDLRDYVLASVGRVAPGSPDRILRLLRRQRALNYVVINRASSLYEWRPVPVAGQLELRLEARA